MKEGDHHQYAIRRAELEEDLGIAAVEQGLAVREQGALGSPGRARCVHEQQRILGRDRLDAIQRRAPGQGLLVRIRLIAARDPQRRRVASGAGRFGDLGELGFVDQEPRPAVLEQPMDLVRRESHIDGDGDRTQPGDGEEDLENRRPVPQQQGDPVAAADSGIGEDRRASQASLVQRPVVQRPIRVDEGDPVAVALSAPFEPVSDRVVGVEGGRGRFHVP